MDYVTIWSDGKININTASKDVLQSLSTKMEDTLAEAIIKYRDQAGADGEKQIFKEIAELKKVPGMNEGKEGETVYSQVKDLITVNSSYFHIAATATCGRMSKKLRVVVYRKGKRIYKLFSEYYEE
jgi:general secretion pathway protein K